MKIFKMADLQTVPEWTVKAEISETLKVKNAEEIKLNTTASDKVDESTVSEECKRIEVCTAHNKPYYCNSSWKQDVVSHLKEYAMACGMAKDSFRFASVEHTLSKAASSQTMLKTASVETPTPIETKEDPNAKLRAALGDPFRLERKFASDEPKANWQTVTKESKMKEVPSIANGVVIPLRGSENYNINSDINPAKNQNSITNPNAIKVLAESEEMDTGLRLKAEKVARENFRQQEIIGHEKEIVNNMVFKDIVPKGKVFPTESLNAQNGLSSPSSERGVYAKFDKDSIPEKTAGEKIKESNAEHKQSIQRKRLEDDPMQMSREASRTVSDILAQELKKALKK